MYLSKLSIKGFRLFGSEFEMPLTPGLNVLAGENDSGKTAIIDAIRLALGTTSQDFIPIEDDDFNLDLRTGERATQFSIRCKFEDINQECGLPEHVTYEDGKVCLYVTFAATRNDAAARRRRISISVRSGRDGNGPLLDGNVRSQLQATYLRPLRNAERELDAGRNSRLSQILQYTREIAEYKDEKFDPAEFVSAVQQKREVELPKSIANVSRLADHLVRENEGVSRASERLDTSYLAKLDLGTDSLGSRVSVAGATSEEQRLRAVLEKLELRLSTWADRGGQLPHGLGYNNLLFMACELLLLGQERDTLPLLLIEEPEAHLHPQLQLRLVEFLQEQARAVEGAVSATDGERQVQIIVTTHSPNLASKVKLANMIIVCNGQAFPMGPKYTRLSEQDYRFLERFLDVTRANLFFARGVLIVEGDAENILVPTLARLLGRDLTRFGISIVNVGSRGLRRYARIFRRAQLDDGKPVPPIPIRVACLADRDIKPDCAQDVLGEAPESEGGRSKKVGPRFESDLPTEVAREQWRQKLCSDDGENVRTFPSDHWTLEYDLAHAGLGCALWQAVALAETDARSDRSAAGEGVTDVQKVSERAIVDWAQEKNNVAAHPDARERLACLVYKPLLKSVSKSMTAQRLASLLEDIVGIDGTNSNSLLLRPLVPSYIRLALDYVTGADESSQGKPGSQAAQEPEPSQ